MGLACVCRCYVDIDLIWLRIATDSAPSIVGFLFNLCAYTWAIRKARSVHRRAVSGGGTFYHGADPARLQLVERVVSNASKCTSWWLHGVRSLHSHMERAGRAAPLPLTPLCFWLSVVVELRAVANELHRPVGLLGVLEHGRDRGCVFPHEPHSTTVLGMGNHGQPFLCTSRLVGTPQAAGRCWLLTLSYCVLSCAVMCFAIALQGALNSIVYVVHKWHLIRTLCCSPAGSVEGDDRGERRRRIAVALHAWHQRCSPKFRCWYVLTPTLQRHHCWTGAEEAA